MDDLIVKHNQVIRASYRLTPNEQAIILTALSKLPKGEDITDKHPYELDVRELAAITGISKDKAYQTFKACCFELQDRRITIDGKRNKRLNWLQMVEYKDGEGTIGIQFSNPVLPYLSNLHENFTSYNLRYVAKFKSTYGVRIYELMKQWGDSKSSVEFSIDKLKFLFLLEEKYERTDVFKRKVIEPAIKDINVHSDILISYENIKTGRKITGFRFKFKTKKQQPTNDFIEKNARAGESWKEAKDRLIKNIRDINVTET